MDISSGYPLIEQIQEHVMMYCSLGSEINGLGLDSQQSVICKPVGQYVGNATEQTHAVALLYLSFVSQIATGMCRHLKKQFRKLFIGIYHIYAINVTSTSSLWDSSNM